MNCHNNNDDNGNNKKGFLKFGAMMGLCCILPIILVALLPLLGFKALALSGLTSLICPIMMIGMMFMMGRGHKKGNDNGDNCCSKNEDSEYINVSKKDYEIIDKNK